METEIKKINNLEELRIGVSFKCQLMTSTEDMIYEGVIEGKHAFMRKSSVSSPLIISWRADELIPQTDICGNSAYSALGVTCVKYSALNPEVYNQKLNLINGVKK